ncbi:heme peroxidase [Mycena sanguinolenta]|nr:heme peroxidase [Mycena sanguinolenta]
MALGSAANIPIAAPEYQDCDDPKSQLLSPMFMPGTCLHCRLRAVENLQFAEATLQSFCWALATDVIRPHTGSVPARPPSLVPEPFDTITSALERFAEVGFSPAEVVALLASHTIAAADNVDPTIPGTPFDSTPGIFDTQLFVEMQLRGVLFPGHGSNPGQVESPLEGMIHLNTDATLARDDRTSCIWHSFVTEAADRIPGCDDIVPVPKPVIGKAHLPAGKSMNDIEQALSFCATAAFPTLTVDPGPQTSVPPVPPS